MIQIENKSLCCGCNACGDVCVSQAIRFKIDKEGFWYPQVDKTKCTNCALCVRVCPILNTDSLKKNDFEEPVCFAAEHKNIEIVFDSTSGGLFSALADRMYKKGGYVGGAIFESDFSIKHFISDNKKDLPALRSSKYAQSDLSGFFKKVKRLVKNDEDVLVCGCPCQMAALRAYLKNDYPNLIIADFICRGINSPKAMKKYLDTFEERYGSPVVYSKAKSKEYGWRSLTHKVVLANGKTYYETKDNNLFTKGYLSTGVFCRPSCYECRFKGFPRISDITLADYWGIEKVKNSLDKDLGTSLVMINSKKGLDYFETIKPHINYIQTSFQSTLLGNLALIKPLDAPKVSRLDFFEDLDRMTFTEIAQKYIVDKSSGSKKQLIKRYLKELIKIVRETRLHARPLYQLVKYNGLKKLFSHRYLLPSTHCVIDVKRGAKLDVRGISCIGSKKIKRSKVETRLLIEKGASLIIGDNTGFMAGSTIEVFSGGILKMGDNGGSNVNCTIVCAEKIEIGNHVRIGRNVTIRDNNGNHYLNRQGYKNSRPVIIEDKVWLCEGCTIMAGVKIGQGAIVGANAFVTSHVPPYTLVAGNPARVLDKDILWKY